MIWYWTLGVLAALLLLVCLTRVGVLAAVQDGTLTLNVRIGLFKLQILPKKKKASEPVKSKKTLQSEKKKTTKPLKKPSAADIKEAAQVLLPPLKRALGRTRRGIRIHPLRVAVTLGGREDPASTAELYGYLHSGMWTIMPELERLLDIPDPRLHIGMDFEADAVVVEGEAGITIRIGTLLSVALTVGIPALRWFLRYQKKEKQQPPDPSKTEPVRT